MFSIAGQGTHGTAAIDPSGTYDYVPAADWHGTDTFTYTLADAVGTSAPATVTITVDPINDNPTCPGDVAKLGVTDQPIVDSVARCTDVDGDTVTYAKGSEPWHGSVALASDGSYTFTPPAGFTGPDGWNIVASDGHGGTTNFSEGVQYPGANTWPSCWGSGPLVAEDAQLAGDLVASCWDNDADAHLRRARRRRPRHARARSRRVVHVHARPRL